ncbi:MAG: hypothetical protein H0W30_03950 [Gemmatimonadaceae bacterium]|nr:hypothetical protein [Gemmatimonadaceae bacterium]MDQ3516968.1 hypothetical protein [Gemmatimonadota bacterium]
MIAATERQDAGDQCVLPPAFCLIHVRKCCGAVCVAHTVVPVDSELVDAAITRWIRGYAGQPFSLCDAISLEVMRRERIAKALTFDNHFTIAGFTTLR